MPQNVERQFGQQNVNGGIVADKPFAEAEGLKECAVLVHDFHENVKHFLKNLLLIFPKRSDIIRFTKPPGVVLRVPV